MTHEQKKVHRATNWLEIMVAQNLISAATYAAAIEEVQAYARGGDPEVEEALVRFAARQQEERDDLLR